MISLGSLLHDESSSLLRGPAAACPEVSLRRTALPLLWGRRLHPLLFSTESRCKDLPLGPVMYSWLSPASPSGLSAYLISEGFSTCFQVLPKPPA